MTFEAWLTISVVVALLIALARNVGPPDFLFVGAAAFLALTGVITPKEAFSGFANPGVLTVAALFIVAAALRETGIIDHVGRFVLGRARTEKAALSRLAATVLPMSAFLNNTPIVAMCMPMVLEWCRRNRISPSRLLIPLSYFAILGGTCTLIGTSTNLVVHGLMLEHGVPGMTLFEIAAAGIPYSALGLFYIFAFGRHRLPDRKDLIEQLGESRREYLLEMEVQAGCRLANLSVVDAGLRNLPGLFLIEIERGDARISPVAPDEVIFANDRLIFTGIVSSIIELEKIPGLAPVADPDYEVTPARQRARRLCEAVISGSSPLVGKTVREADFRAAYGAAVLAVHRGGSRVEKKVGDIRLRPGDTLLLQTGPNFIRAHRNDPAFYLVSNVKEWRPLRFDRAWVSLILFAVLLVLMSTGWVDIVTAAILAAFLCVAGRCISAGDARRSIEWPVLITIASAFGIGTALFSSGAASELASGIVSLTESQGPIVALACIYLIAWLITEMVTNNAAAALMFPFCMEVAKLYEVSPRPFLMALVLAASASFSTPIGYQTNMMVYGPGGYRFGDFARIGLPLNLLLWLLAIIIVPVIWPF